MSIGGGSDETMLSIICKYMDAFPRKWCIFTLPWKLRKQEHDLCCTLKVTSNQYTSSWKQTSNFAIKMHIKVFHHYHCIFPCQIFVIWSTLKPGRLLHSVFSVGYLSFPMIHAKNTEKKIVLYTSFIYTLEHLSWQLRKRTSIWMEAM